MPKLQIFYMANMSLMHFVKIKFSQNFRIYSLFIYISLQHGYEYDMVMLWLPIFFTMEFYNRIIGK